MRAMLFTWRTALSVLVAQGILVQCDARRNGEIASISSHIRSLVPASVASASSSSAPAVSEDDDGGASTNIVVTGFNFVKDQIQSTISGIGECYSDHKLCDSIRKKQGEYKRGLKAEWEQLGLDKKEIGQKLKEVKGGITYDEFRTLRRGKEDRNKVFQFFVTSTFAPKIMPYLMMASPERFLPSPFMKARNASTLRAGETRLEANQRLRSHSIFRMLINLEQTASVAKPSLFLRKNQIEKTKKLVEVTQMGLQSQISESTMLDALESRIFTEENNKSEISLSNLPSKFVRGLSEMISSKQQFSLYPGFLLRAEVLNYLRKIQEEDDFLVQSSTPLTELAQTSLVDACETRMIGVVGRQRQEMESKLADWLNRACVEPQKRVQQSSSELVYNGNLARSALLCYNAIESVQDQRANCLPKLLVQQGGSQEKEDVDV
mmetsp:Transcript_4898/g.6835  ORF Transcript_4898/g.6835 Transcript_4898/m.6835 type:complete len:435 (-) Transcript_4898:152-1456(-)